MGIVPIVKLRLKVTVKDVDYCRKDLIVMVVGYDGMGQYRYTGKSYKEYGCRSFHTKHTLKVQIYNRIRNCRI